MWNMIYITILVISEEFKCLHLLRRHVKKNYIKCHKVININIKFYSRRFCHPLFFIHKFTLSSWKRSMANFGTYHVDVCVICKKEFTCESLAVNVGGEGLQTLVSFCELSGEEELHPYLLPKITESNRSPVSVHQKWHQEFTDKRRIRPTKESNDSSVSKRLKRSAMNELTGLKQTTSEQHVDRSKNQISTGF